MSIINITTQRIIEADTYVSAGPVHNCSWLNNPAAMVAAGWRTQAAVPDVASGYTRVAGPTWEQDPGDPEGTVCVVTDRLTADIEAEQAAAAKAARDSARVAFLRERSATQKLQEQDWRNDL